MSDKDFLKVIIGKRCKRCHYYFPQRRDLIGPILHGGECLLKRVGNLWGIDFEVKYTEFDVNEKGVTPEDVCLNFVPYISREVKKQ